jgi:simple sugar transport system permease protein
MILKTMLISGGLAGLVAIGPLLGDPQFHRYNEQFPTTFGFTGITVALVGRNRGGNRVLRAALRLHRASDAGVGAAEHPAEISKIMQGSIILSASSRRDRAGSCRGRVRNAAAAARAAAGGAGETILSRCPRHPA